MNAVAILGRKYSTEILSATDQPVTVGELRNSLDIPVATCYRRVDELTEAGLLEKHTVERDGSEVTRFQRTTDGIDIRFDESVSVFTWPPASRRSAVLDLLMSPFERLEVIDRLSLTDQLTHTEISAPATSVSQEPTERDRSSSKLTE